MSFKSSVDARIFVGMANASCYARSFSLGVSPVTALDVSVLCKKDKEYIPGAGGDHTLSIDGPLDTDATANGFADAMFDLSGVADVPVTACPLGTAAGDQILMGLSQQSNITVQTDRASTVDYSLATVFDGRIDFGAAVEAETTITADTSGSAQNNGAATTNGGVAHLHVTAYSGLTSDVITIEHSVNGTTGWSTLVTFTTVTGRTSERIEVAAGTTVRQYLRVVDDVTGTGSITRFVGFARR